MNDGSSLRLLITGVSLALALACGEISDGASSDTNAADPQLASRRFDPGCDPGEASLPYKELEGGPAFAKLAWNDMPARIAELEIPVEVVAISPRGVMVSMQPDPVQDEYMSLWRASGHFVPIGRYLILDPCSATLTPRVEP